VEEFARDHTGSEIEIRPPRTEQIAPMSLDARRDRYVIVLPR
jgi:hypothetical protein